MIKTNFIKTIVIGALIFTLKNVSAQVPYSFTEGFEGANPVSNWVAHPDMLPGANVTYTVDNLDYTEGNQSLKVNVTIPGRPDTNANWYYYLKIPVLPYPNLEDSLSFSADIKMDEETSLGVRIGLNLPYYPASSGVFNFPFVTTYDQWYTVYEADLNLATLNHAESWTSTVMYSGEVTDVGRGLNFIGIIIKGKGSKIYQFNLDNINISGFHTDPTNFTNNYTSNWENYITRVNDSITEREVMRANLNPIPDVTGITICPIHTYKVNQLNEYLSAIDSILSEMNAKNDANLHFHSNKMTSLDNYFVLYNNALDFLNYSLANIDSIALFDFPAMEYFRLQGDNTPPLNPVSSYNLRMTADEYQSIGTLISPTCTYGEITVENSDFVGSNGTFPKENLDMYIAKIWYQAGLKNTHKKGKFLTQELLLKDESLVEVDFVSETNYLRITNNTTGVVEYIDISDPNGTFPNTNDITFNDSTTLQPFELDSTRHKLLWSIIHIPANALPGNYTSTVTLKDSMGIILKSFDVNVRVLPFDLHKSRLDYSLYYHGKLDPSADPVYTFGKSYAQKQIELKDMMDHGVLYPASYDYLTYMDTVLDMRATMGLPTDRFYTLGLHHSSPTTDLLEAKNKLASHGYNSDSLYVYGIDEADTTELLTEIIHIQNAHSLGIRVFTAGYNFTHDYLGDYLDHINYARGAIAAGIDTQVVKWHQSGQQIFAYASPQVGVENPEIYRKNFGCLLWQKGLDGAMNYAYQKQYGIFWNDFDDNPNAPVYREETFTYPTTNGIVGTVEWEGYRAAITDVRYISTLLNIRDALIADGQDVSDLNTWINSIDCSANLDELREDIIDKILMYDPAFSIIDEEKANEIITIFPNPTNSILHIQSSSAIKSIYLISIDGKKTKLTFNNQTIDISNLAVGIYFLKIETETEIITKKFIKQ